MMNIFICKNVKNSNEESLEIKKHPIIKKDLEKEIFVLKKRLTTRQSSTDSLSVKKINPKEEDSLNIIEYPENEFKSSNKLFKNHIYPKTKILNDDENDNEINILSNTNIMYNIEDHHNYDYNNKILKNEEIINNKYCIYCEEIYKNAFKTGESIEEKNCIYCNKLVTQEIYEELINEGLFQSDDDDDSVIVNCKSYYGDN